MNLHPDRFTAILDACVLVGPLRRDTLLSLAEVELFRPRWSNRILQETQKAIEKDIGDYEKSVKHVEDIEEAFPDAVVAGYEPIERGLSLPDPKDNHVLAAALAISASVIVTDNLKDFPEDSLSSHNVEAKSADNFIADTIELSPTTAMDALRQMRNRFRRPKMDASEFIGAMESNGLAEVANTINHFSDLL